METIVKVSFVQNRNIYLLKYSVCVFTVKLNFFHSPFIYFSSKTGLFNKQSNSKTGYKKALTVTLIFNSKQMQNMPSEVNTVKLSYSEHAHDELIFIPRDFITCFKLDGYNK